MNAEDKQDVRDAVRLGVLEGMEAHYEKAHKPLDLQISSLKRLVAWGTGFVTAIAAWLKFGGH